MKKQVHYQLNNANENLSGFSKVMNKIQNSINKMNHILPSGVLTKGLALLSLTAFSWGLMENKASANLLNALTLGSRTVPAISPDCQFYFNEDGYPGYKMFEAISEGGGYVDYQYRLVYEDGDYNFQIHNLNRTGSCEPILYRLSDDKMAMGLAIGIYVVTMNDLNGVLPREGVGTYYPMEFPPIDGGSIDGRAYFASIGEDGYYLPHISVGVDGVEETDLLASGTAYSIFDNNGQDTGWSHVYGSPLMFNSIEGFFIWYENQQTGQKEWRKYLSLVDRNNYVFVTQAENSMIINPLTNGNKVQFTTCDENYNLRNLERADPLNNFAVQYLYTTPQSYEINAHGFMGEDGEIIALHEGGGINERVKYLNETGEILHIQNRGPGGDLLEGIGIDEQGNRVVPERYGNTFKFWKVAPTSTDHEQVKPEKNMQAYPNPARGDKLSLSLAIDNPGTTKIEVFNIKGQTLHESKQVLSKGKNILHLDSTNWPSGIMLIRQIDAKGQSSIIKFTKIN